MELYQLEYFRILCKHGNFTSASEELMVTQPAVSTAIKKLEEEFNVELIDRDSKEFTLTRTGEVLLRHAVAVHNEISSLNMDLNPDHLVKRESIRFAFPFTMCPPPLPNLLTSYIMRNQSISLNLLQKGHGAIASGLAHRNIDLGILSEDFTSPLLNWEPYIQLEIYACLAPDHPLCAMDAVTPEMLKDETLIFSSVNTSTPGYIRRYLDASGIQPREEYHSCFPDACVHLAQNGRGIVLAPKHLVEGECRPLDPPLSCCLDIAWNGQTVLTREQQDLIDFLLCNTDELEL